MGATKLRSHTRNAPWLLRAPGRCLLACDPGAISERTRVLPIIRGFLPDLVNLPGGCVFRDRCDSTIDACSERPAMQDRSADRRVACHRAGEMS